MPDCPCLAAGGRRFCGKHQVAGNAKKFPSANSWINVEKPPLVKKRVCEVPGCGRAAAPNGHKHFTGERRYNRFCRTHRGSATKYPANPSQIKYKVFREHIPHFA